MKGLRTVMNGSLDLNSTRLARFCIPLATSLSVRSALADGDPTFSRRREGMLYASCDQCMHTPREACIHHMTHVYIT